MKAIIIDDEKPSRDNIKYIMSEYFTDIVITGEADNVQSGIELIGSAAPDLVFLDMEMGVFTGFDVLKAFDKPSFEVIFITAYSEYAVNAFRTHAVDYILKPINIDDLREAINKAKANINIRKLQNPNITNFQPLENTLKVSTTDGIEIIPFEQILYLQSINYYTNVVLVVGREIITSRHLKDYEENLKNSGFFRIHNSFIINTLHLKSFVSKEGFFVELTNGKSIKISRRRKEEFLEYIKKGKRH